MKEVLGFLNSGYQRLGAKLVSPFWINILNELKNGEVEDILIAYTNGLTGFPDAIRAVYQKTRIQLCIVNMVCNLTKIVAYKDHKAICTDFETIYITPSEMAGHEDLEDF